jgi:hypothetical protein
MLLLDYSSRNARDVIASEEVFPGYLGVGQYLSEAMGLEAVEAGF